MSYQIKQVVRGISDTLLGVRFHTPEIGDQVIYIPEHVKGEHMKEESWGYPYGIQPGFVTKDNGDSCFIRYWKWDVRAKAYLPDLRTTSNSENTDKIWLFYYAFWDVSIVKDAILEIQQELHKEE